MRSWRVIAAANPYPCALPLTTGATGPRPKLHPPIRLAGVRSSACVPMPDACRDPSPAWRPHTNPASFCHCYSYLAFTASGAHKPAGASRNTSRKAHPGPLLCSLTVRDAFPREKLRPANLVHSGICSRSARPHRQIVHFHLKFGTSSQWLPKR